MRADTLRMELGIFKRLSVWIAAVALILYVCCFFAYSDFREQLLVKSEDTLHYLHAQELLRLQSGLNHELKALEQLSNDSQLSRALNALLLATHSRKAPQFFNSSTGHIDLRGERPLQPIATAIVDNLPMATSKIHALEILDNNEQVVARTERYVRIPDNIQLRSKNDRSAKFDYFWTTQNGNTIANLSVPIFGETTRIDGYIKAQFHMDSMLSALSALAHNGTSTTIELIHHYDNQYLPLAVDTLASTTQGNTVSQSDITAFFSTASKESSKTSGYGAHYNGTESVYRIARLKDANLLLMLSMSQEKILASTQTTKFILLLGGVLSGLVLLLGLGFYVMPLRARIKNISAAAQCISERNYDIKLEDNTKDEIGALAFQLTKLAGELSSNTNLQVSIQEQIKYRDKYDEQTDLLQRKALFDSLTTLESNNHSNVFSAIAIDLSIGKQQPDDADENTRQSMLISLADIIKEIIPERAHAARWQTNQLMLVLPDYNADQSYKLIDEIKKEFEKSQSAVGANTVSVRYSTAISDESNKLDNIFKICIEEIAHQKEHSELANETRNEAARLVQMAIEEDRIIVCYQPVIEFQSNGDTTLVGVEAMVRLRSSSGDDLMPENFMPHIQNHPVGAQLDKAIASSVIRNASQWKTALNIDSDFAISINLSNGSVSDDTVIEHLQSEAKKHQFDLKTLVLEISAPTLENNVETVLKLKSVGVKIAIDDMGLQQFSIVQLKKLHPDLVKINWKKISSESESSNSLDVKNFFQLLDFFRSLGIGFVSKSIENKGQALAMRKQGITLLQGFYFGAAVDQASLIDTWQTRFKDERKAS